MPLKIEMTSLRRSGGRASRLWAGGRGEAGGGGSPVHRGVPSCCALLQLAIEAAPTAEPSAADRQRIGVYVLLFIALFFIFAWLLNREYWKDVH